MKKFNLFKMLAVLIVLITSINTAWATSGIKLRGDYVGGFSYTSDTWTKGVNGDETKRYWDVYHSGGSKFWRLWLVYYNHDGGPDNENEDYDLNEGTSAYMVVNKNKHSFVTTADPGILRIKVDQYGSDKGRSKDEYPYVWVERPDVEFKYPWDGTNWTKVTATDNRDGTYTYEGTYRGVNRFNAGPNGADKIAPEGSGEGTTEIIGSPTSGRRCQFKWQPGTGDPNTDYKYTGGEEDNRGRFTITKLCTITYYANGGTGDAPDPQEVLYGADQTLRGNTGSLAKTDFVFVGWNTASDGSGKHYDVGATLEDVEVDVDLYAEWVSGKWGVKGSGGDGALGDWNQFKVLRQVDDNVYRGSVSLGKNQVYEFKITDNTTWYGKSDISKYFLGQTNSVTLSSSPSEANCIIATGNEGDYTFEFDESTGGLIVTYPNGNNHPSTNFVYYSNPSNWGTIKAYIYDSPELTTWANSPILGTPVTISGQSYYYTALGDRNDVIFHNGSGNKTSDIDEADDEVGHYYNTSWAQFTVRVTLNNQSATSAGTEYKDVKYNYDELTTSIICPTKTGYNFGGYYTETNGGGVQIINASGVWQAPVSGYTDGDKKWIKDGGTATLYAKWTEKTWNVTAQVSPAGAGFASPSSATSYGEVEGGTISASNNTGYHFTTWTISSGSGTFESAATTANNTFYPTANTTLTATFEANTYTINLNNKGATGGTLLSSVTATYNSNSLSTAPVPTKWGNVFGGWEDGDGTPVIDENGALIASVTGYTDASRNWIRDDGADLYAKWTVDESKTYTLTDGTTPTSFVKVADGIYRATRTMAKDNTVYLYDGTTAAGPTGGNDYVFSSATGSSSLGTNSDKFKYTGTSDQTIVYKLNLNNLTLSIGHVVFYLSSTDKAGDSHADVTDYAGSHADLASISGTFEYRLRVNSCTEWSTLYLPFDPTEVTVWGGTSKHHLFPYYYNPSLSQLYQGYYVLRTPASIGEAYTDLAIEDFDLWLDPETYDALPVANTPYIVQWRHNYFSTHPYISIWGSGMTPSFDQPENPDSDDVVRVCGNGLLTSQDIEGAYVLESDYGGGAWLRGANPTDPVSVGPFQCYILASETTTANTLVIKRRTGEDSATDLEDIYNLDRKEVIVVYTISGLRVAQYNDCSFEEAGRRMNAELSEGIYILNAGNESVKLIIR